MGNARQCSRTLKYLRTHPSKCVRLTNPRVIEFFQNHPDFIMKRVTTKDNIFKYYKVSVSSFWGPEGKEILV